MKHNSKRGNRSIALLRDSVARKIAAGEVIDRPFSVLREFLDNAIDSGADGIDVYLEGGGTRCVRVVDDGCGMCREDLEICFLPHATSKISEVEDLDSITSMGFRGEALSSIAACSRLNIISAREEGEAMRLRVENGKLIDLAPYQGRKGTVAEASDLFYSIPARKRFLKSDRAELSACRKLFVEKALAFPEISFRLFSDNSLKLFLPAAEARQRIHDCYPSQFKTELIHRIPASGTHFRTTAYGAGLSLTRKDRRMIHIYVNRRKIEEFSLVQAVEYGYGEYLPGGCFPLCVLFIDSDPNRVDFNIHPAKKEVRFHDLREIHHEVSSSIRSYLRSQWQNDDPLKLPKARPIDPPRPPKNRSSFDFSETVSPAPKVQEQNREFYRRYEEQIAENRLSETSPEGSPPQTREEQFDFRYLGQSFGLFLIAEREERLYLIDQHAAHERILYNRFSSASGKRQKLLIPRPLECEAEQHRFLLKQRGELESFGIVLEEDADGICLTTLPESCVHLESEVAEYLSRTDSAMEKLPVALFATLACKAAVKDGEYLPPQAAKRLIKETFALKQKRCPHGRPVFHAISREELFQRVGRSV